MKLSVVPDLRKKEREANKRLRNQLREKRDNGEEDGIYRM